MLNDLIKSLNPAIIKIKATDLHPSVFEKDDDQNYHIDFIHAAANLRARNYKIPECDQ